VTTVVVFSMNRALQCDSLLQSLRDQATNINRVAVIARATTPEHRAAYDLLQERFPAHLIVFEDRYDSCSALLAQVIQDADHVCLTVDDQLFYAPSDFKRAVETMTHTGGFVWSWRLGEKAGFHKVHAVPNAFTYWSCPAHNDDPDYGYVWHSDGAIYRRRDYEALLDRYLPRWQGRPLIPNDLEAGVASMRFQWARVVGPHIGPANPTCITWQINKQTSTEKYGAPWAEVSETTPDALAGAYLGGKRVDNEKLYGGTWISRFCPPGSMPTHVAATPAAALFYASLIK
jgi:hypothetical protein